jgi:hypothetical protein
MSLTGFNGKPRPSFAFKAFDSHGVSQGSHRPTPSPQFPLGDRNELQQNYDWISKSHGDSKASSVNKKEWVPVETHCLQKGIFHKAL